MSSIAGPAPRTRLAHQIALHGLVVRIACPVPRILALIESRLANFTSAPDADPDLSIVYNIDAPAHTRPDDGRVVYESPLAEAVYSAAEDALYAFHQTGATMRCAAALGRAEITGSRGLEGQEWVLTRPLLTLALMELVRRRNLHPLHAACLASDGAGVIVCGPSGSGKSTLALALLEAGLDFLADDLVFLQRTGPGVRAFGFPDELGLVATASAGVPRLPPHVDTSTPRGWPKARADVRFVAPAATVVASCQPVLVLLLSDHADDGVIAEADADDALLELLPSILLTDADTCTAHLAALATLTASATILRTAARPDVATVSGRIVRTLSRLNDF